MDIATLEARFEEFSAALSWEHYRSGAGLKDRLETAAIYRQYADLFSSEAARAALQCTANRRERYIAEATVLGYFASSVRDLTEELANSELAARVEWDGRLVPYRAAGLLVAGEPKKTRRDDLHQQVLQQGARLNGLRQERWCALYRSLEELEQPGYVALLDWLRGLGLEELEAQARRYLEASADWYYQELEERLGGLGVPLRQANTADLAFLFRAPQFDDLFPGADLVPALKKTLAGLGFDLARQSNIELDLEPRPLKSPRAFCAVIRAPGQVKLVVNPRGGRSDYHALLHEAGHAEHYGNTSPELPYAFRKMGGGSLSEVYAFLFDNLLASEAWLHDVLGHRRRRDFLRFERLYKVFIVRRYCGKLQFELELHRAGPGGEGMGELYRELLNFATGVENAPSRFLEDLDDHFYSAQYLRAWIAEAQLRRHLEERFGETWFEDPGAGEFLGGLWTKGTSLDIVDLVRLAGYGELDVAPLLEEAVA